MNSVRLLLPALALGLAHPALGDTREAARRAVQATVAVEFEARKSPPGPTPAAVSGEAAARAETFRQLLERSGRPNAAARARDLVSTLSNVVDRAPDLTMASGTMVSPGGLIVTFGLPSGEGRLKVTLSDGAQHTAQVVARDLRTGLHLLRLEVAGAAEPGDAAEPVDLPAVSLAERRAEIGEPVVAAYCLSERDRAVSRGIVAATQRTISGFSIGVLQTDVAVGRMSAGGPLVDESGSLAGIIAAVPARDADARGVTLAIPAEHVRSLLDARREGEVAVIQQPRLGIEPAQERQDRRVVIRRVFEGSPAQAAGLRAGDEIVSMDSQRVPSPQDVVRLVSERRPGDRIEITIRRDGQEQVVTATLTGVEAILRAAGPPEAAAQEPIVPRILAPEAARLYVPGPDGTLQELPFLPPQPPGFPDLATLRVERSDVEKKLDELSRDVRELRRQIDELSRRLPPPRVDVSDPPDGN